MNRLKLIGSALVVVVALSAIAVSGASAALPEFSSTFPNTFKSKGGAATFEQKGGLAPVSATSSEGKGEITSAKGGTFDELFLGTTAPLSGKCTGLDDKTIGSVLAKGTFKLGYLDAAKTKPGLAFTLNPETHFECEKTITLVTVRGCAAGELGPTGPPKRFIFNVTLTQAGGVNTFTQILNATNTAFEECKLLSEINGGTFKQSGQATKPEITTAKEAELLA